MLHNHVSEDNAVDVSIVLPIYNEADHLEKEIDRIHRTMDESSYTYEILVVDDGSTDGSGELAETIDGIRVIRFGTNRGSGSARKYGTMSARGRVVVWTDVDMTYPNDTIPDLVAEMEGFDQVVGARRTEEGTVKLLRRPAKWFIRRLASYLTRVNIPDLNSGFRAFRRDVADQFLYLLPTGFSCVTTITMAFLSNGYSIKYVPMNAYGEYEGQTTLTHGVELGVARASSRNLDQATETLIDGFIRGNSGMRIGGREQYARLSGREAIVTPLERRSALGGVERVEVHTTMLSNGDLFYLLTVAPDREYGSYGQAFNRVINSVRINYR